MPTPVRPRPVQSWSVQLLLARRPPDLGEVLRGFVPNLAARLSDTGAHQTDIPVRHHLYRVRLEPGADPRAADDLGLVRSTDPDLVAAEVATHVARVTVTPVDPVDDPDQQDAGNAVVLGLLEPPVARVVWWPHQRRLLTAPEFLEMRTDPRSFWCAVHTDADPAEPGRSRAWTAGLDRMGMPELRLSGSSLSPADLHDQLRRELHYSITETRRPAAGARRIKVNKTWYDWVDGTDADGRPVLDLVPDRGRDATSEAGSAKEPRRGLFRR
jgi:hypothetical protein